MLAYIQDVDNCCKSRDLHVHVYKYALHLCMHTCPTHLHVSVFMLVC